MYSNPPTHGARIAAEVVGQPAMFDEWKQEMEMMAGRIKVRPATHLQGMSLLWVEVAPRLLAAT